MLALAITLPVVVLVVIPGFLLIFGLGRSAVKEAPRPADVAPHRRTLFDRTMVDQTRAARYRELMRQQAARANYN